MKYRELIPKNKRSFIPKSLKVYMHSVGKTYKIHLKDNPPYQSGDRLRILIPEDKSHFFICLKNKTGVGPILTKTGNGLSCTFSLLFKEMNILNRRFTFFGEFCTIDNNRGYKFIIPPLGPNEPIPELKEEESPFIDPTSINTTNGEILENDDELIPESPFK